MSLISPPCCTSHLQSFTPLPPPPHLHHSSTTPTPLLRHSSTSPSPFHYHSTTTSTPPPSPDRPQITMEARHHLGALQRHRPPAQAVGHLPAAAPRHPHRQSPTSAEALAIDHIQVSRGDKRLGGWRMDGGEMKFLSMQQGHIPPHIHTPHCTSTHRTRITHPHIHTPHITHKYLLANITRRHRAPHLCSTFLRGSYRLHPSAHSISLPLSLRSAGGGGSVTICLLSFVMMRADHR